MPRREDIDNAVWGDEDYLLLSPDAKLVYLWSFTNPACGMAGLYKAPRGLASFQTRVTERRVERAVDELAEARFMFWEQGVVFVRSRVKHLRTKHDRIATSIISDVKKITEAHPLRKAFLAEYADDEWLGQHLENANLSRTSVEGQQNVNGGSGDLQGQGKGRVRAKAGQG